MFVDFVIPSLCHSTCRFTAKSNRSRINEEDDGDGDEDEEELLITRQTTADELDFGQEGLVETADTSSYISQIDLQSEKATPDKLWKRVKDPRGLPEQNARVSVQSRSTLKDEIIRFKLRLHNYTMRFFDDRMFIVNKEDPGYSSGDAQALHQVIGTNKYNGPITAKIASYGAPGLESLKVMLSLFRATFNLMTWRDPILTSIFLFGVVLIIGVLLVFPWRLFFFVVGFGAVGPQVIILLLPKSIFIVAILFDTHAINSIR